ncbi:MAG: ATP-grasp domain-containing protein [bacterium]
MGTKRRAILFTTSGRSAPLIKLFRKRLNPRGYRILAADASPLAPSLHVADRGFVVPGINDAGYCDEILNICFRNNVEAVVPLNEADQAALLKRRSAFPAFTTVLASDVETIETCDDKIRFFEALRGTGLNLPATGTGDSPPPFRSKWIVKPRAGGGASRNIILLHSPDELWKRHRTPGFVVQDFVEGTEYTVDTFSDLDGNPVIAVPRERISVRHGQSDKGRTLHDETLSRLAMLTVRTLRIVGPANTQFICSPDGACHLIETNPRFSGGIALTAASLPDLPDVLLRVVQRREIPGELTRFREILMVRHDSEIWLKEQDGKLAPFDPGSGV